MNEEIYIDGVNVANCEFFNDCECKLYKQEYWERTDTTYDFCKKHPFCEYKATAILERLEQENKELKEYIKDLQVRKDRYYLQALEYERQVSDWITFYIKNLDSQGLQDLRRIISEV